MDAGSLLPAELWLRVLAAALRLLPRGLPRLRFWCLWKHTCVLLASLAVPDELSRLGPAAWDQAEWSVLLLASGRLAAGGDDLARAVGRNLQHFQLDDVPRIAPLGDAQVAACAEVCSLSLSFTEIDCEAEAPTGLPRTPIASIARLYGRPGVEMKWTNGYRGGGTLRALKLAQWPCLRNVVLEFSRCDTELAAQVARAVCCIKTVLQLEVRLQDNANFFNKLLERVLSGLNNNTISDGLFVRIVGPKIVGFRSAHALITKDVNNDKALPPGITTISAHYHSEYPVDGPRTLYIQEGAKLSLFLWEP